MKKIPKPYFYLLIACALALAVWVIEKPIEMKRGDVLEMPLFQEMDFDSVARIEIEYLLQALELKKENGQWFVAQKKSIMKQKLEESEAREKKIDPKMPAESLKWEPADPKKIELHLDILKDAQLLSFVGDNPKKHGFFEVNAAGMELKLFSAQGELLAHLFLGKGGPGFTDSYVRRADQTAVYLANRNLRGMIPADADDWRMSQPSNAKKP